MKLTVYDTPGACHDLMDFIAKPGLNDLCVSQEVLEMLNTEDQHSFYDEAGINALIWAMYNNYQMTFEELVSAMVYYLADNEEEVAFAQKILVEATDYAEASGRFDEAKKLLIAHRQFPGLLTGNIPNGPEWPELPDLSL